jgi:hypothetical protein
MAAVGCGDDDSSNGDSTDSGGTFTLTNIPAQYNGKYAVCEADDGEVEIWGFQTLNLSNFQVTLPRISNGTVTIPLWLMLDKLYSKYTGNHTIDLHLEIVDKSPCDIEAMDVIICIDFDPVVFSNGNAIKSWNEGIEFP